MFTVEWEKEAKLRIALGKLRQALKWWNMDVFKRKEELSKRNQSGLKTLVNSGLHAEIGILLSSIYLRLSGGILLDAPIDSMKGGFPISLCNVFYETITKVMVNI